MTTATIDAIPANRLSAPQSRRVNAPTAREVRALARRLSEYPVAGSRVYQQLLLCLNELEYPAGLLEGGDEATTLGPA